MHQTYEGPNPFIPKLGAWCIFCKFSVYSSWAAGGCYRPFLALCILLGNMLVDMCYFQINILPGDMHLKLIFKVSHFATLWKY